MYARQPKTNLPGVAFACSIVVGLVGIAVALVFFVAPTEATMGDVQRIVYLHVAVAWYGLLSMLVASATGAMYLTTRRLDYDHWSHAATEVGSLCSALTLITGSMWAHEAWGTWWTWEPRLTTSLVMWMMYAGLLLIRSSIDDPHRSARVCSVLAIICVCDVPLVLMATRWFRGVHPVSPEMDHTMRVVLLVSIVSFSILFTFLTIWRTRQLHRAERIELSELSSSLGMLRRSVAMQSH